MDLAVEGGGGHDLELWMHNDVKREFIKLGLVDVRFIPEKLMMGITENAKSNEAKPRNSMKFNGFNLFWAPDVPWRTIFGWPDGLVRQYPVTDGPSWVPNNPDGGGGILVRKFGVAGTYEAQLTWMGNVGTDVLSANAGFVMRNINSNIDRVPNN